MFCGAYAFRGLAYRFLDGCWGFRWLLASVLMLSGCDCWCFDLVVSVLVVNVVGLLVVRLFIFGFEGGVFGL